MNWIDELFQDISTIPSTKKDLKKFGLLIGIVLLCLSTFAFWKGWWGPFIIQIVLIVGLYLILSGFFFPQSLRWLHKPWMSLAVILGSVVSRIMLSILFFVVLTPMAVIARLFHKKFFLPYKDKGKETYWLKRDKDKKINYEQMF